MTRKEYIDYCGKCQLKSFNRDKGIICSLTKDIANFDNNCSNFTQDPSYIEVTQNPNKNRTIIISLVAVFIIGTVVILNVLNNKPIKKTIEKEISFFEIYTKEDCLEYTSKIEYSLLEKDPLFLNRSLDYNYLLDYITFQRKMSDVSKQNFKKILKQNLKPGNLILQQLEPNGHFSFRKYYERNNKPHLVFRFFNNQSILILDFELGIYKNKIVIKNAYNYVSGEYWGETFYKRFNQSIEYKNKPHTLNKYLETFKRTNELISIGEYKSAELLFEEIPLDFINDPQTRLLEAKIAYGINKNKYIRLMDRYINTKPEENRFTALNHFLKGSLIGDIKTMNKHLNDLNELLNDDPIMDFYIASGYSNNYEYAKATEHITQFKNTFPKLIDGYILDLDIQIKALNFDFAVKVLEDIYISFSINKNDINDIIKNYPEFNKSSEYQNFFNYF